MPETLRDRDPALALSVEIIIEDSDSAQVLVAVTFSDTDGKQINVKKKKQQRKNSPRNKPGSTNQTANGNCLAALHLSSARNCDLVAKYLLRQHKATHSMLNMSDLA